MIKYKFTQAEFKYFLIETCIVVLIFQMFQHYINVWILLFILILGSLMFSIFVSKYTNTIAEFYEDGLILKKPFKKNYELKYEHIEKVTYSYDRFHNFFIYTNEKKIKVPPPSLKLEKVEELFEWLKTKNPSIKSEIYLPKKVEI